MKIISLSFSLLSLLLLGVWALPGPSENRNARNDPFAQFQLVSFATVKGPFYISVCEKCSLLDGNGKSVPKGGKFPLVAKKTPDDSAPDYWEVLRDSSSQQVIKFHSLSNAFISSTGSGIGKPLWADDKNPPLSFRYDCTYLTGASYLCFIQDNTGNYLCPSKTYEVVGDDEAAYAMTLSSKLEKDCFYQITIISNMEQSRVFRGSWGR